MSPMRSVILLAVLWVSGSILFAAENAARKPQSAPAEPVLATAAQGAAEAASEAEAEPRPAEAAEEAAAPAQAATQEATQEAQAEDEDPEPERASAADRGSSPQRFVPSEQVRADFDVSFPIDI